MIRIQLASIFVDDQEKALKFYTEVMGFARRADIPMGEFRWLTVVSPEEPEGTELLLEPNSHPAAIAYQQAIYQDAIPATTFFVEDIQKAYEELKKQGVVFTMKPTESGTVTIAVLDDTCGNLIQLTQV